ncbi:Hypothetical predicted protein [Cloeon dipterum]|uniref:SOCS box domain-containing protein n=1 Tax=Cloeon dipterum TaxID=197152 RepID=A0A8S1CF56_9INSE|nr:Hypothetical predicted protein [Cloeon dipterum]
MVESIIEVFFDTVFADLERDGLAKRYKRRCIADYLSTIISASEGSKCEDNCALAVTSAVRVHSIAKADNGQICPLGKHHNVLYVAAKLSFDWRLSDSQVIAAMLKQIFDCEKTFERIVIAAILGPLVTRLLSGWQADYQDEQESLNALDYYLQHATTERQTYKISGCNLRMVDVPMPAYHDALPAHLACVMDRPTALLLLLRHGARLGPGEHGVWTQGASPVALVQQLLRLHEIMQSGGSVPSAAIDCLRLIMRALPHAALGDERLRETAEIVLPKTRWAEPPELKHIARCAVRRELGRGWSLPDGIEKLNVPTTLKPYLDLMED